MTRLAYTPTDECPSVFDDMDNAQEVLEVEKVPSWLASILTDAASHGWTEDAIHDMGRQLYRHVQPFFDVAQDQINALHRNRRRA